MIKIHYEILEDDCNYNKNKLYKITNSRIVKFLEEQSNCVDMVDLHYCIEEQQYGIFAYEYRNPNTCKRGGKAADILACIIDDKEKIIHTTILDVKHNISAFSDDLLKEGAMLTAIKSVKDFIEQIRAEILHKNSFLLFYKDEDYIEYERIGIVTSNFDRNKFLQVSETLEDLLNSENNLITLKLKNSLSSYKNEIVRIKDFADRIIKIGDNTYNLEVFMLEKKPDSNYLSVVKITSEI